MSKMISVGKIKVRWHDRNGQWMRGIGYGWNRQGTKLVQRDFYFGADDATAIMRAAEKIAEWKELVNRWPVVAPSVAHLYIGKDLSRPFWIETTADTSPADEVAATTAVAFHTIRSARDLYKREREERIGLRNAQGLKRSTVNTDLAFLDEALRQLNPAMQVAELSFDVLRGLVRHQYERDVSERTALNYCRALKKWLDWMADHPNFAWVKPKGTDSLFKLGTPSVDPYVPADDEIKAIARAACDRTRLFILLGLNCGATQVDIGGFRPEDLIQHKGEWCLWWSREKTSHQNAFRTLHWLFPETRELIEKLRAPKNPHGLLFLTADGRPLHVVSDKGRSAPIYEAFAVAKRRAAIETDLSFKSFRKYGSNALHDVPATALEGTIDGLLLPKLAGENLARLYLGQKLPPPLNSYLKYKKDHFGPLTAGLRAFHAKLKASGAI